MIPFFAIYSFKKLVVMFKKTSRHVLFSVLVPSLPPILFYCGLALGHIKIKESKGKGVFVVLGGLSCIRNLYLKVMS